MLGTAELIKGDETILVLILVLEDLADNGGVLLVVDVTVGTNLLRLLLQEAGDLILGEERVSVGINLLEHIGGSGAILDINKLNLKSQGRLGGDQLTCALVSVAEVRGDDELPLLPNAHVQQTLLPSLDHLTNADLELERLATVVARVEFSSGSGQRSSVMHRQHVVCLGNAIA